MKKTCTLSAALALALLAGGAAAQIVGVMGGGNGQGPQQAPLPGLATPLFLAAPGVEPAANMPPEYDHSQSITLNAAALRAAVPGRQFLISPEPGVVDQWFVESVSEPNMDQGGYRIVRMSMANDPTAYAAFCTYQDATAMTMQIASRKVTYRLQYLGNDAYHVWKLDPENTPNEGDVHGALPDFPPRIISEDDDDWRPEEPPYAPRDAGACGGTSRVLDIMIVYTGQARDAIGGTTAMRAECALAVDHANTAYIGSAMSTRMRLVYCDFVSYTESGDQDIDLPRLRSTNDGFMDGVHTIRDTVNADMVALVNDTGSGLGYCPGGAPTYANSPFNTCKWTRVAATFTLAHECGHNQGAGHDVANGGACGPSYGVGHLFGPSGDGWCTVMAYPTSSNPRVLRFSNPNINYNGYATGVAIGSPGEAFNARVIIDNDNTIEAFEATRYDIYVNFAWGGLEFGLASFPYNTVAEGVANIDTPNVGAGESPTLYITSGAQNYIGTISKVMNIIPCGGAVTIGTP
jgi:hypothetical protein